MKKFLERLKEPFPDRKDAKKELLNLLGVGIFVSLFLYLVRPFGIEKTSNEVLFVCLGFGGVTILFGLLYDLLGRYVLRLQTDVPAWTLGKWILNAMGLILWIAIGNYLFISLLAGEHIAEWPAFFQVILSTLLVGIFPIVFSGLMIQMKAIRTHLAISQQIHPPHQQEVSDTSRTLSLSLGQHPPLEVRISDLRFIEAMQNYVSVYYWSDNLLKKEIYRSTLSSLEAELAESPIMRCHRSYLVNTEAIENVSGNAQGLKLRLTDVPDQEIPVSRSYISQLKAVLA